MIGRGTMSNVCNKCGTNFDSPFCPNCGTQAQQTVNVQQPVINQQPRPLPPPIPTNVTYQQNQSIPYQNIRTPEKKHGCLFWGVIISTITIGVIIFSIILISCLQAFTKGFKDGYNDAINKANNTVASNDVVVGEDADITSTLAPTITSAPDEYLSEDEIQYLYSKPKDYIGKRVNLSGVVFTDPEKDEEGTYFQMFQDAVNSDNNTFITYYDELDVENGDYVIIDGIVDRDAEGMNAFGATINAPGIIADSVIISTYQEVVSPTEKTVDNIGSQEQYGYEITVDKVEFSPIETRMYITVNNNGSSNFSVSLYSMKLVQGSKQYEQQDNYEAEYPEVQTDLIPGTTTSGVVCFPVINQADDFTLYIEGYSDNWEEEIEDYMFDISTN